MKYRRFTAIIGVLGLLFCSAIPAGASSLSTTTLMTPGLDGTGANGLMIMGNARTLSRDGRITVFATRSSNHVANDSNGVGDVFTYDRISKKTELISRNNSNLPANGESAGPTVSADGRFVAYFTEATDILPEIGSNCPRPNQCGRVIVHDRTTGGRVVANRKSDGVVIPSFLYDRPSISGNGRFVAFASRVPDPAGGTLPVENIFRRDLQTNTTDLISADSTNSAVRTFGGEPSLSHDGRYATFTTAEKAVFEDTNDVNDVYVRDMQQLKTMLVSVAQHSSASANWGGSGSIISSDGRFIAFHSYSSDLTPGDTRGYRDIFVRDLHNSSTQRISLNRSGVQGNFGSHDPDISDDGRFITYYSEANNLVAADSNSYPDILLYDRFAGITRRVNVSSHDGPQANGFSDLPAISGDGKAIIFRSRATNLIPPATGPSTNNLYQVYNPVVHIPYYDPGSIFDLPGL